MFAEGYKRSDFCGALVNCGRFHPPARSADGGLEMSTADLKVAMQISMIGSREAPTATGGGGGGFKQVKKHHKFHNHPSRAMRFLVKITHDLQ